MATFSNEGVLLDDEPTADENIRKVKVPAGTPMPDWITSKSAGFPSAEYDTWYYPTQLSYLLANLQAAWTTASELPQHAANAFHELSDLGKWVVGGLGLWVLLEILRKRK